MWNLNCYNIQLVTQTLQLPHFIVIQSEKINIPIKPVPKSSNSSSSLTAEEGDMRGVGFQAIQNAPQGPFQGRQLLDDVEQATAISLTV